MSDDDDELCPFTVGPFTVEVNVNGVKVTVTLLLKPGTIVERPTTLP
jgi:hypothetical protein